MSNQKKKVNKLKLKECKSILNRLAGQKENKYYKEVLVQYKKIAPSNEPIDPNL